MNKPELAQEICAELRAKYQKPMLRFELELGEPGLRDSKVGGTPYLPAEMAWPLDSLNRPMPLLAQIDCTQLVPLPDFPHTGLLQFFAAADEMYGADFEDWTSQKNFRILYHAEVDPSVTAEMVQAKRPPFQPENENYLLLGDQPCRICFQPLAKQGITPEDYQFDKLFIQEWNRRCPDMPLESVWGFYNLLSEKEQDCADFLFANPDKDAEDEKVCHQLGGYPYFTQCDPRSEEKGAEFDTLLFQLDSDYMDKGDLVMWGDAGVGNFWISSADLKRLDFSRVGYNWDCC